MLKGNYRIIEGWIKSGKRSFRDKMEDAEEEEAGSRFTSYVDYCWAAREAMHVVVSEWMLERLKEWNISQEDLTAEVVYRIEDELRQALLGPGLSDNLSDQIEELLDDIDEDK